MSFATLNFTFIVEHLSPTCTWLWAHTLWVSVQKSGDDSAAGERDGKTMFLALEVWLRPVCTDLITDQWKGVAGSVRRKPMDWTGSVFDMFGIDVSWERFVENVVPYEVKDLFSGGEKAPQT